jgi:hypothetical protein
MRWRVRVGYPLALIYCLLADPTAHSILWGGLITAFGLMIRGFASGHLRKYEQLATEGPYACTRNPLYFGSAFLAAGFIVAGHSWWAGAIIAAYFAVFYYAVMRNEESDLRSRYGHAFDQYAARVPLFFPRIAVAKASEPAAPGSPRNRFSWAQYMRNREYKAFIGALTGMGIVWLRMWIRTRFEH